MRFIFEESHGLEQLNQVYGATINTLIDGSEPQRGAIRVSANKNLLAEFAEAGVYVLREGMLTASINERSLLVIEENDAIFVAESLPSEISGHLLQIQSDFATVFEFYSVSQFDTKDASRLMLKCMAIQQHMIAELIALLFKGEKQTNPAIRTVKAGDAIVSEGEISDQVFTLLEGHAQVSVEGELVGEVHADELVGVIGALCGIPRIATVTASKDSLLMSLAKDDFVELLTLRPHTVMKLIEDFARVISSSNQELRELKRSK